MFRSLLFIPANNPSMLQNADIFMSDGIIFDLEDAVAIDEKDNARDLLETYLKTNQSLPKTICLRVNDVFTPFIDDDLKLLLTKKIDYLVLPKANIDALFILDHKLNELESLGQLNQTKLICLLEDSSGIIQANEIATHPRVEGLLLGAEDLTNELEIERTTLGEEIFYPRSKVIYAAAYQGILSIDTPFTDINDIDGLKSDCLKAKQLGMKAKTAIHPSQIEMIHQVFSPSQETIDWAMGVMKIHKEEGQSLFQYQGKMIDKPVIERARKIIEKAKSFDLL
jgi:citrate lyase subunit beta/citryl-CoA lyase